MPLRKSSSPCAISCDRLEISCDRLEIKSASGGSSEFKYSVTKADSSSLYRTTWEDDFKAE